jgi:preprotein translocase subunit SecE
VSERVGAGYKGMRMAEAVRVRNEEEQGTGGAPFKLPGALSKIGNSFRRFREFLHEVRVEMKNVTWPTPTDVRATTGVVIVTVLFFGVFLFLVDRGVSHIVERVLRGFRP